jgi:hypothetical protein
MATSNASQGNCKIDMDEASCSSPPAPTPANTKQAIKGLTRHINMTLNHNVYTNNFGGLDFHNQ